MIIVLQDKSKHLTFLLKQLELQELSALVFNTAVEVQYWLEFNPDPSGIIVDFSTSGFQDFLIRFSLRCPDTPVLSLKEQSEQQLNLRFKTFVSRLLKTGNENAVGKILLVDDSRTVRMTYRRALEKAGFDVEVASDAQEGMRKAIEHQYDLAIIDYFMPGDNGAELCRKLHANEKTYELVCSILTAQYKQSVVDECLNAGARECMFKNESSDLFLTRVRSLIRSVERKKQIDQERARLIGLLYSVAEGVYGVNSEGRIQFVNPATLDLLGQPLIEIIGRFPHECIHPTDNVGQMTSFEHCFLQQAYLLGDELRNWRTLFKRADGSLFPVECSVTLLGERDKNQGSVVVFRDISEQDRLEKNWQWQLTHDHLTGLLNKNAFEEVLNQELLRVRRTSNISLLLFIDLDKFKLINDKLGHAAGDQLLINLADSLSGRSRDTDYVGRLSGDEFVVLLTGVAPDQHKVLADKYRLLLEESSLFWQDEVYSVTGSLGVTRVSGKAQSVGELLAEADLACQIAKRKGRNQWAFYEHDEASQNMQGNWSQRLRSALKEESFTLLQQSVLSIAHENNIVGRNCFLRLQEGSTLISPAIFMSDARRFGLIKDIDNLVLRKLVKYCRENKSSAATANMSWYALCLSVEAISNQAFRTEIPGIWRESGLPPERLRFEIGEEELFNFSEWKKHLSNLREQGFGVIISHFGMNSQTVLNLPQLPVDAIKLDTSLTRNIATNSPKQNLIDAIVKTARESEITVIGAHIESKEELSLIKERNIEQVQGFYLGKPESFYNEIK